jgi:hypothetical protein
MAGARMSGVRMSGVRMAGATPITGSAPGDMA